MLVVVSCKSILIHYTTLIAGILVLLCYCFQLFNVKQFYFVKLSFQFLYLHSNNLFMNEYFIVH